MSALHIRVFLLKALCLAAFLVPLPAAAQDQPGLYIIYDSSNSMWGELPDGSRKYEAARTALRNIMDTELPGRDIALRIYGNNRPEDCSDSTLAVPFQAHALARDSIITAMEEARPTGRTPIDRSLRAALADFGDRSGSILLISDGIESCDADPCALVREWQDKDIDITVHVVGLGLQGKDREAMQCIADAAGTTYQDAASADQLVTGISAVIEDTSAPDFALVVITPDGVEQKGAGTLTDSGSETEIETNHRYTPTPGTYTLTAGVMTLIGEVYAPVTQDIEIAQHGRTTAKIEAPRPPEVGAEFFMDGTAIDPSGVTVYREGQKLGTILSGGPAFLPEGTFDFETKLTNTNQTVRLTETLAAGDSKTLIFEAVKEVRLVVNIQADTTGEKLKGFPTTKLWKDGEIVYELNNSSGGLVRPGDYRVQIDDGVNRFEAPITVVDQPEQTAEFRAPTAAITVRYQSKDGTPVDSKRVFIERAPSSKGLTRYSEQPFALTPGRYIITGWPAKNGYPVTELEVQAGEEIELTLQATE